MAMNCLLFYIYFLSSIIDKTFTRLDDMSNTVGVL